MAEKRRSRRSQALSDRETYVALLSSADRVRTFTSGTIEPHGITGQQYNVLRILRGAEPEGLPTLTIAERMIERAPGMTRMIDRLEAKGLAIRERRPKDRRCVHCRITLKGLELLRKLDRPVDQANNAAFMPLSRKERDQLVRLLSRLGTTSDNEL